MKFPLVAASALLCSIVTADVDTSSKSTPVYKNPKANIEDRVKDLVSRMTIQEKTSQLIQGDISNWINMTDNTFNATGLQWNMENRGGSFYVGFPVDQQWINNGVKIAQE